MSIRRRLVLVVLALVTVALVAIGATTYEQLDRELVNQVDQTLDRAILGQVRRLAQPANGFPDPTDTTGRRTALPNPYFVELLTPDGRQVSALLRRVGDVDESPPTLPADLTTSTTERYTVDSIDGTTSYRLRVVRAPEGIVVVGASLADADSTLNHVLLVEIIGGIVVLVALVVMSLWLVGVGLRPLRTVEKATTTIAAGDYSHRVAVPHPYTEVGALATSFNSMLEQIETSFSAQQATEERLRRFVSDASHELKTPLTSIRGYAELYRAGVLARPEELARAIGRIEQEATRMGLLVEDLLLLARLDEGRPIEREPVDLAALVHDVVGDALAVEPNRVITVDVVEGPIVVAGDRARLVQVLANLLGNVRDHAGDSATVTVSVRAEAGVAHLDVQDTGVGMAPEVVAHAFDRFFRADEGRSRAEDHVGLGLSIVASIVQAHGGTVEADSTVGQGTTIRCTLPTAAPAEPPAAVVATEPEAVVPAGA